MTRKIKAFKGGRSVRKSSDVTPEVARMLAYLKREWGISLGDLIDMATRDIFVWKHSQDRDIHTTHLKKLETCVKRSK